MQNGAPQASTSRSTQETEQTAGSGPVSYQRASSGRPKLTLSPPLAEHEQQYPLFQGIYHPSQPNRESDVTQPQSNVAQKQTLNSAAQKTAEMQWEPDTPRWWTFTLPAEAMKKVDAYWHAKEQQEKQQRHSSDSSDSSDSQQQQQPPPGTAGHGEHLLSEKKQQPDSSPTPPHTAQSFSAKIGGAFAGHSGSSTPWMAPWTPFRAPSNHNIERGLQDPDSLESHAQRNKKPAGLWGRIQNFLLFSAFAPFWLRFINLAFTATVLGLAAKIHQSQQSAGFGGLIGASTVMILVIGPLSIVHIFGGQARHCLVVEMVKLIRRAQPCSLSTLVPQSVWPLSAPR